jgi:hypothetical protein
LRPFIGFQANTRGKRYFEQMDPAAKNDHADDRPGARADIAAVAKPPETLHKDA